MALPILVFVPQHAPPCSENIILRKSFLLNSLEAQEGKPHETPNGKRTFLIPLKGVQPPPPLEKSGAGGPSMEVCRPATPP